MLRDDRSSAGVIAFLRSPGAVGCIMNEMRTGQIRLQSTTGSSSITFLRLTACNTLLSNHPARNPYKHTLSKGFDANLACTRPSWDHISLHHMVASQIIDQRSVFGSIAHGLHNQRACGSCKDYKTLERSLDHLKELRTGRMDAMQNRIAILPAHRAHIYVGSKVLAHYFF